MKKRSLEIRNQSMSIFRKLQSVAPSTMNEGITPYNNTSSFSSRTSLSSLSADHLAPQLPQTLHPSPAQLYREYSTKSTAAEQHPARQTAPWSVEEEEEELYGYTRDGLLYDQSREDDVTGRSLEAREGWNPTPHAIDELTSLPPKIDHPGAERYVGSELKERPRWLWDSLTGTTVLAEDHMFDEDEGYVAVSYTWGRWRQGWRQVPGTSWPVPSLVPKNPGYPDVVCNFSMTQLKDILHRMPRFRYFWIDVLCIPQQGASEEKTEEIGKQGAIFKNANGVLVYLWSLDDGTKLKAAIRELYHLISWYWQINVDRDSQATTECNDRQACNDDFGPLLRNDPWFSSLWTFQEMILAPASVWIAQDGSFCRVNGTVLTTYTVGNRFYDIPIREAHYHRPGSFCLNPSHNRILSMVPQREKKSKSIMEMWLKWAFQETSITNCTVESRCGMLLGTCQRKYSERRDLAVWPALKLGYDKGYKEESVTVDGISIGSWNDMIKSDGARLFFNVHTSPDYPLTNMLPSTADWGCFFSGIRATCDNWKLREDGTLKIGQGSQTTEFLDHSKAEYQLCDETFSGGDPVQTVKKHLQRWKIRVKHIRFIVIGHEFPYIVEGGRGFSGVHGVILVTKSGDIYAKTCHWYKAGTYYSADFKDKHLEHDIIVSTGRSFVFKY